MFTGIIRRLGAVESNRKGRLGVRAALGRLPPGSSVAVNGVCLTLARRRGASLEFDMSSETLRRTTLGFLRRGDRVHIETPLRPSDMIGGHFISGHVDARAEILAARRLADRGVRLRVALPKNLFGLVAEKGSIAVDGVSLTVTRVGPGFFETVLVPYTLRHTALGARKISDVVNLEADMLARYVRSILKP